MEPQAVVEKAKKEADEILETAEKERIDKLMDAANEAREKWREQIENLKEQIDEMAEILNYGNSKGINMGGVIFGNDQYTATDKREGNEKTAGDGKESE